MCWIAQSAKSGLDSLCFSPYKGIYLTVVESTPKAQLTWLIVEDDMAIRTVLKTMCDIWGYQHVTFPNGFKAMAYLEQDPVPDPVPDVALLDIRMPGPWGHEISRAIREHNRLQNIPIFLMTAYELPGEDKKDYMDKSGADALLSKPLPAMDDLQSQVTEAIKERRSIGQNLT